MPPILMTWCYHVIFSATGKKSEHYVNDVRMTYIWAGHILSEGNDCPISTDIVSEEPPPLTLYFAVQPSTGIFVEDIDDLTSMKGQASSILLSRGKVMKCQNKLGCGWLNMHGLISRGLTGLGTSLEGF